MLKIKSIKSLYLLTVSLSVMIIIGCSNRKTSISNTLASAGSKKIQVIKVVREITALGLKEAKALVDGAPKPLKEGVDKETADKIKAQLEEQGATIEIK